MIQSRSEVVNIFVEMAAIIALAGTIALSIWGYFVLCALLGVPVD